jgi:hypothetical protein
MPGVEPDYLNQENTGTGVATLLSALAEGCAMLLLQSYAWL